MTGRTPGSDALLLNDPSQTASGEILIYNRPYLAHSRGAKVSNVCGMGRRVADVYLKHRRLHVDDSREHIILQC